MWYELQSIPIINVIALAEIVDDEDKCGDDKDWTIASSSINWRLINIIKCKTSN